MSSDETKSQLLNALVSPALERILYTNPETNRLPEMIADLWEVFDPVVQQQITKAIIDAIDYDSGYGSWQQVLDKALPSASR